MTTSLVIFDCDGVLVDSERLINAVESAYLRKLGLDLSPAAARALFKGKRVSDVAGIVEARLASPPDGAWLYDLAMATARAFASGLAPIPGIVAVIQQLRDAHLEVCVASQAPPARTELVLELTGLAPFFGERVFTAFDVRLGKPHPDLFLHAAARLGYEASACAVVEDSVSGVRAGVAAGMRVFGYGADGVADELATAGATVFGCMTELPGLLGVGVRPTGDGS